MTFTNIFSNLKTFLFSIQFKDIFDRIQIKLFWILIFLLIGISIGLFTGNALINKKIDDAIFLGSFIHTVDDRTEIYDIIKRIK